ncbi:hypothetical protein [Bradyrhizobium liaoningense]|uniref:hypothetical protein n=1 Tax=Bradyrhizobium liaoningense TaxID=43992 RepID=UPI001BA96525|nr:hypothetical protein [Bradyrhizobium liaoningense]MBR0816759.1 hypothetical protein [Bradyrhizobium liaoningense]
MQHLLRDCEMPIVEIALTVCFQNLAHFATTFGRFAGDMVLVLAKCSSDVTGRKNGAS